MITYNEFLEKVKQFEGLKLKTYKCPKGILTIGYGHTHGVTENMIIDEFVADAFLRYDMNLITVQLRSILPSLFKDEMPNLSLFIALKDFIFNVGITKFRKSTLLKILKTIDLTKPLSNKDINRITIQLLRWTKTNGKTMKGLEARRQWEIKLLTMK